MTVLALHGFTGCGADFAPFAQLCPGEWHCPDLPGHGVHAALDCSPKSMQSFVQKQATDLPQGPRILLGYSMGARAALQEVLTQPQFWDGLILISGNPGIESEAERAARRASDATLATQIETEGLPAFYQFWQQQPLIRSQQTIRPDWLATMQAARLRHTAEGLAANLRQFGQGSCPNLWPKLSQLRLPVLCIAGALDAKYIAIAERMAQGLPHAQCAIIPNAGHMPHLEAPEPTAKVVQAFLPGMRQS